MSESPYVELDDVSSSSNPKRQNRGRFIVLGVVLVVIAIALAVSLSVALTRSPSSSGTSVARASPAVSADRSASFSSAGDSVPNQGVQGLVANSLPTDNNGVRIRGWACHYGRDESSNSLFRFFFFFCNFFLSSVRVHMKALRPDGYQIIFANTVANRGRAESALRSRCGTAGANGPRHFDFLLPWSTMVSKNMFGLPLNVYGLSAVRGMPNPKLERGNVSYI